MLKIGRSVNPKRRLASGTTFCSDPDARLIAVIEGAGCHEDAVHRAFSRFHSHKEWFYDAPEIRQWIVEGCHIGSLPKQVNIPDGMSHRIPVRHNPRHIAALASGVLSSGINAKPN